MNIPMYGALKRCTPLVNLVLAVVYLKKPLPSPLLLTSVFVITFGCVIAGEFVFDAEVRGRVNRVSSTLLNHSTTDSF